MLLACAAPAVGARTGPPRNVTVVVPLGAGSASDVIARVVMEQVGKQVGQTFVIENRPGAGGTIGANMVAKSAPDGYTVLAYGALALGARALFQAVLRHAERFHSGDPASASSRCVVVTSPDKGYKTLADLVAAGKAKPGDAELFDRRLGSASHFGAERLRVSAGFKAQHIPFKGAAESADRDRRGPGGLQRADRSRTTLALIRDGKLAALAVSAAQARRSSSPDVPTTIEAGLPPNSVYPFYSALYLPAKTPRDIVEKLHRRDRPRRCRRRRCRSASRASASSRCRWTMEQFGKFFRDDVAANVALVKAANIPTQ